MDETEIKKSSSKAWFEKAQLLIATLAIITPAYYFIGYSYNLGLLTTYGVSSNEFQISVQETCAMAYLALMEPVMNLMSIPLHLSTKSIATISLICFVLILVAVKEYRNEINIKTFKNRIPNCIYMLYSKTHWKNNSYTTAFGFLFGGSVLLYFLYTILLSITLIWIFPFYVGYKQGESYAKEQISSFRDQGCVFKDGQLWGNCRVLQASNGRILYEGILIGNTDSKIAFFTKHGAVVAQIPDGAIIITPPKEY